MFKKILLSLGFLIIAVSLAFAQDVTVEFEGRYWITDLEADARVVESNVGSDFNFESDLGVQDEDFPEGRVTWHISPNSRLRFAYTHVNYSGDKDITRTIEFKGKTYTVGARVTSDFDVSYFRFGWIWQFLNLLDKIKLGPVIEAKAVMADMTLDAPNLSPAISESEQLIGVLPTVGIALDVNPIKKLNLFAEISGFHAGDYGYFFDAEAGIKIIPIKNFSVVLGIRMIDIQVENDPDYVSINISGPFVSGILRF